MKRRRLKDSELTLTGARWCGESTWTRMESTTHDISTAILSPFIQFDSTAPIDRLIDRLIDKWMDGWIDEWIVYIGIARHNLSALT
jgi:hypothetical protein